MARDPSLLSFGPQISITSLAFILHSISLREDRLCPWEVHPILYFCGSSSPVPSSFPQNQSLQHTLTHSRAGVDVAAVEGKEAVLKPSLLSFYDSDTNFKRVLLPHHQAILQHQLIQFNSVLTLLPELSIRSPSLRDQSYKTELPNFRHQSQVQVVTCASD